MRLPPSSRETGRVGGGDRLVLVVPEEEEIFGKDSGISMKGKERRKEKDFPPPPCINNETRRRDPRRRTLFNRERLLCKIMRKQRKWHKIALNHNFFSGVLGKCPSEFLRFFSLFSISSVTSFLVMRVNSLFLIRFFAISETPNITCYHIIITN